LREFEETMAGATRYYLEQNEACPGNLKPTLRLVIERIAKRVTKQSFHTIRKDFNGKKWGLDDRKEDWERQEHLLRQDIDRAREIYRDFST